MTVLVLGAANTLPGFAQGIATLLSGTFGWLLLIGLMISGVICLATRHPGAFATDALFCCVVAFFIFNPTGAEAMLHSAAQAL